MKLTIFIAIVFTTILSADTLESCKKTQTSFWNMMFETYNSADKTFMGTLDEEVQMSYYKMALKKIDRGISEVKKECKGIASKEILDACNQKKSKIASKMNAL